MSQSGIHIKYSLLEKVQMRATRLISKLRNKSYEERLRILDLPTLKYRRVIGDMIETYKILSEKI